MNDSKPILALDVDGVIIDGFPRHRWDETLEADLGISPSAIQKALFDPHWHQIMLGRRAMMPVLLDVFRELGIRDMFAFLCGSPPHPKGLHLSTSPQGEVISLLLGEKEGPMA